MKLLTGVDLLLSKRASHQSIVAILSHRIQDVNSSPDRTIYRRLAYFVIPMHSPAVPLSRPPRRDGLKYSSKAQNKS